MNTHLHDSSVCFATCKTGKTKCGKRVARDKLAKPNVDADCAECRARSEQEFESAKALVESCRERGVTLPDCDKLIADGVSYRNQWIAL